MKVDKLPGALNRYNGLIGVIERIEIDSDERPWIHVTLDVRTLPIRVSEEFEEEVVVEEEEFQKWNRVMCRRIRNRRTRLGAEFETRGNQRAILRASDAAERKKHSLSLT